MELMACQNFDLIRKRVLEARKRRDAAVHRQQARDEVEWQRREDMKRYKKEQRQRREGTA